MNNNKIYWGLTPQVNGEYININTENGMMNYCINHGENRCKVVSIIPSKIHLRECVKAYSKLDKKVKNTIDNFAKEYPTQFNRCINM